MIDLSAAIRTDILADPLAVDIGDYLSTKALFTRRPAPNDATNFPQVFVSPQINGGQSDFINKPIRDVIYDIAVYGKNGNSVDYRLVEKIAFAIAQKYKRLGRFGITCPTGYSLVKAVGLGPRPAPTDDEETVGRVVSITFTIQED